MSAASLRTRVPRSGVSVREAAASPSPISLRALIGRRKVLTLDRLRCIRKEDLIGRDEVRLEIRVDGQFEDALRMKLGKGESATLRTRVEFDQVVEITLFDEDISKPSNFIRFDHDDELGSHTFRSVGDRERAFHEDGAHYVLDAHVRDGDPGAATTAWQLVDEFEASTARGGWPRLSKATIIEQMRDRLARPWRVNQGPTNTCAPAAVVFDLIRRSPRRYVRLVRSLYETGEFVMKDGTRITTSPQLRAAAARSEPTDGGGAFAVPEVDWLVLASMRESANVAYTGPETFDNLGSTHWEVAGWLFKLNGYNHVRYFPGPPRFVAGVLSPADVSASAWIAAARKALGRGGAALASIDSSMVDSQRPGWWSFPEHIVAVLDRPQRRVDGAWPQDVLPLSKNVRYVTWSSFTWGGIVRRQTRVDDFESGMWMLITAY